MDNPNDEEDLAQIPLPNLKMDAGLYILRKRATCCSATSASQVLSLSDIGSEKLEKGIKREMSRQFSRESKEFVNLDHQIF